MTRKVSSKCDNFMTFWLATKTPKQEKEIFLRICVSLWDTETDPDIVLDCGYLRNNKIINYEAVTARHSKKHVLESKIPVFFCKNKLKLK